MLKIDKSALHRDSDLHRIIDNYSSEYKLSEIRECLKYLSWQELADKIKAMSEDERKEPVKVWGEDRQFSKSISLQKESEDLCYLPEYSDECYYKVRYNVANDIEVSAEHLFETKKELINKL